MKNVSISLRSCALLGGLFCAAAGSADKAQAATATSIAWSAIAARTLPATVNITVSKVALGANDPGTGDQTTPGERNQFFGSGFVVDPGGIIVTNKHVIDGALTITVTLQDHTETRAKVLAAAQFVDLALLKVDVGHPLPTLKLGNGDAMRPGDPVLAIGDPLGVGTSLSAGIISGTMRDLMDSPYDDYLQTDAAINPGNSGGPLVDASGNVIGVDTLLLTNQANGGSNGVNFAISSNIVAVALKLLSRPDSERLGWIGAHLQGVMPDLRRALDVPAGGNVIVSEVDAQSAASAAGLKPGDVILRFGDETPPSARALMVRIAETAIGATRTLQVWSAGKIRDVAVTIRAYQGMSGLSTANLENPRCLPPPDPDLGLLMEPITPLERQLYSLDDDVSGLVVVAVNPMSEAYGLGFRSGIVIEQINGQPIATREQANGILKDAAMHSPLVGLLVAWSKGPSWFALDTGYDLQHMATNASVAQLRAVCESGAGSLQANVDSSSSGTPAAAMRRDSSKTR